MQQIDKNTVSSENQLKKTEQVSYINENGKGKRILFVGNSITRHGYKPEIGWYGVYGMAASAEDKDYVHVLAKKISGMIEDPAFCICQVSSWERSYKDDSYDLDVFKPAREFCADIIVMRIMENVPGKDFEPDTFSTSYKRFIDYLNGTGKAQVVLTTSFWKHTGDPEIVKVAEERGYKCAVLGELGEDESMKAIGLFEHSGVANHPGDKGMAAIADAILEKIDL